MRNTITLILFFCLGALFIALYSNDFKLPFKKSRLTPSVKTIFWKMGNTTIPIKIQQFGERNDIVYLNLHDDEITSVEATKNLLEKEGGMLIEIENNQKRNIRFQSGSLFYTVDPNRIFSKNGITKSLSENGRSGKKAITEVEKLAERILQLFPENPSCIIALHNNTSGMYSATSYAPGNKRSSDARKVYINKKHDADDFFLTTDENLYNQLAETGFNTILQDNKKCAEDGSLSVYCGKKNIRYVNLETEHDKPELYFEMMKKLISVLPAPAR